MSERETHWTYGGWPVAAAASVVAFMSSSFLMSFSAFFTPLSDEFGWSHQAVSGAYACLTLTFAAVAPLVGQLIDRWGPRLVFIPGAVVGGCAFASLSTLTAHLSHLYAAFTLVGLGAAGTSSVAFSRLIATWFTRRRGFALAVVIGSLGLGSIVHPTLAATLIERVGWRVTYLVMGTAVIVVAVPIIVRYVHEPDSEELSRRGRRITVPVADAVRSRVFLTLLAVVFGSTIVMNGAIVHLAPLLIDRGIPASLALVAVSSMGAASLVGRLLAGWCLDRFSAIRVAIVLLLVASTGTLLLSRATSFPMGLTSALLIGFGTGGDLDVTPYLLARYFGLGSLSTLYGISWTVFGIAAAAGPVVMGRAFDLTGSYQQVLLVLSVGTLTAAALMLTMPAVPTLEVTSPALHPS